MRGNLSEGVFERRTSSGSEAFSLIISFDATRFVLVRVLILIGTIWPNLWAKLLHENERASLKNVFSFKLTIVADSNVSEGSGPSNM